MCAVTLPAPGLPRKGVHQLELVSASAPLQFWPVKEHAWLCMKSKCCSSASTQVVTFASTSRSNYKPTGFTLHVFLLANAHQIEASIHELVSSSAAVHGRSSTAWKAHSYLLRTTWPHPSVSADFVAAPVSVTVPNLHVEAGTAASGTMPIPPLPAVGGRFYAERAMASETSGVQRTLTEHPWSRISITERCWGVPGQPMAPSSSLRKRFIAKVCGQCLPSVNTDIQPAL